MIHKSQGYGSCLIVSGSTNLVNADPDRGQKSQHFLKSQK